jgi:hypothetical protein
MGRIGSLHAGLGNRRAPCVYWDLPEGHAKLTPETSEIEVSLGPGECASGRSQNKRAHPVFTELDGKLLLTIWLTQCTAAEPVSGSASRR